MNSYEPAANAAAAQQRMAQRREEAARYRMIRRADQKDRRSWWSALWHSAAKSANSLASELERRRLKFP